MCRSIKQLRRQGQVTSDEEIAAAALQFVRKISGYRQPARKNADAFSEGVADITAASARMLAAMGNTESAAEARRVD